VPYLLQRCNRLDVQPPKEKTVRIGCHALVWTGEFDARGIEVAVRKTREAGFDLIEFPLMDPFAFDVDAATEHLEREGIDSTASLGLASDCDISSEVPHVVRSGARVLGQALNVAAAIGASYLGGVIYSSMQKYMTPATGRGRENSVAVLRELADQAAELDITLGLEVVNRYESNVLNTAAQALDYLDEIGRDNIKIHLDTYHMNIEEIDNWQPVLQCGDRLGYVHVGENHRGYVGSGHIDFGSLFQALNHIGYTGPIVFESFSSSVVNADLTRMLGIWRELWVDSDALGSHAATAIRHHIRAAQGENLLPAVLPVLT
jgi:D-psicose/D-tagatose/L-ribulose 3-epimerase